MWRNILNDATYSFGMYHNGGLSAVRALKMRRFGPLFPMDPT
jgi:hypothetical protein